MTEMDKTDDLTSEQKTLAHVSRLLQKHKLVETVISRSEMPHHELVETLVHKQNLSELQTLLGRLETRAIARLLETLSSDERQVIWQLIPEIRKEDILLALPDELRVELIPGDMPASGSMKMRVFDLHEGRLRQIPIRNRDDLASTNPIWIDLVSPEDQHLAWVSDIFGVELHSPKESTDLETSARFYEEEDGAVHLHSDFLFDREDESRNVPVVFIMYNGTLFSVRSEELPVFRLQRLRARAQSGYVTTHTDVLLDLYAADVEYSANALEGVYAKLEVVGKQVLRTHVTDEEAAKILAAVAEQEDLNGRIRRNVLDTRRALSFLMRGKFLSAAQHEDVREILRDIESLDGHTAFLFNKINFLMDATDSSININQNRDIKRLTVLSVVFMPLNVLAGIGGMSEYSMMTQGIPWQVSYTFFTVGLVVIGWLTFLTLKYFEKRKLVHRRASLRDLTHWFG